VDTPIGNVWQGSGSLSERAAHPSAADWGARARQVIPGGINSGHRRGPGLQNLTIVGAKGATFTDSEGQVYTDYHGAFGAILLGHDDPDVHRAFVDAMSTLDLAGVAVTPPEVELAEKLVELVPSFERVVLTVTGSEATSHAVRIARAATGRRYVLKFQGCYHGWTDSLAMNVASPADRLGTKDPLSAGILDEVLDATIVAPFNDLPAVEAELEARPNQVAAVIVEPIPHNVGAILPSEGFLLGLRELCYKHGTVLIFDEVITGFRHNLGGYQAISGVVPDLTAMGKAMANGYPISVVGGRANLMEHSSTVPGGSAFIAGTFNGHPAIAAAALATIRKLEAEPVHEHIFGLGERARKGLREVFAHLEVPAVVSGFGSVFVTYFLESSRVERYEDLLSNDAELFVGYRQELLCDHIFELPMNLKRNHITYAHTEADIDRSIEATATAVMRVLSRRQEGRR
jgi:glutamate-1-semialdehyde 2,1-aminomutase